MLIRLGICVLCTCLMASTLGADERLQRHLDAIRSDGMKPVVFVDRALAEHDLIVFDDALHTALEPWEFYSELLKNEKIAQELDYVFIEVLPHNYNFAIDEYLNAEEENPELLIPAFTNGLHGTGWRYQNCIDFIKTVRKVNASLPEEERIKVLGVSPPSYWSSLRTHEDWLEYSKFFDLVYDFTMYKFIFDTMSSFKEGKKAFYLTNTRHAYTNMRRADGSQYWNATTFFAQWHPGRAYSVRMHNASLYITRAESGEPKVAWARIADGLWDSAFAANGNVPVAMPLKGTPFGEAPYIGNLQLNAFEGSTMQDAYDAVVFVAPLETMRQCAFTDLLYTEEFKTELERRLPIRYGEQYVEETKAEMGIKSVREFVDAYFVASGPIPLAEAQEESVGPIDAWKKKADQK